MNIFVGNNDVGKSNILKALNLFFNNETEAGKLFNFETDFTYLYNEKLKEAKEIKIALTINVPETYKDGGEIVWEKVWRKEGILSNKEKIYKKTQKSDLSLRSRIPTALRTVKYRYVPAVKSDSFFRNLLGTLYDTMSVSLADSIKTPMNDFSATLQNVTKSLSKDLMDSLGFNSLITTPQNLRELFKTLNFKTYYNPEVNHSLEYRGDGIKARHIPLILKYIAEQDMLTRNKGSMRIFTFWGYEEPENNLELSKCFELSEELCIISRKIPLFITTHSPAFYLCGEKEKSTLFYVDQKKEDSETNINRVEDLNNVNENMGLIQLISPFVKEHIKNQNKLKDIINKTAIIDIPTIYVEGKTDKKYLEKAIELYSSQIFDMLKSQKLKIYANEEFGGVNSVKDWVAAWCRTKNQCKMIAIFDGDSAGKKVLSELKKDNCVENIISKKKTVKLYTIPKTDELIKIWGKGIELDYAIEHLFPVDVWKKCGNYLEQKKARELPNIKDDINDPENGLLPNIRNVIGEELTNNFISKKINNFKKVKFCDKVLRLSRTNKDLFKNFKPIVTEIEKFLNCK